MPSVALRLSNVGVFFSERRNVFKKEKFWVLKDISMDVFMGETLGIIGKNGAGKSTLLQVLAGIISPNNGIYKNYGHSVSSLSLNVGFSKHLTGKENAIISGMLMGMNKSTIISKIDDIKDFSELGDYFDQPVKTYSTGMKARLGFSIAVQSNPDILLIDEILGVGDSAFRKKSSNALKKRICSNKTVVLVSHNTKTIKELCNRALLIENGQKMMESKPDVVLNLYKQRNNNKTISKVKKITNLNVKIIVDRVSPQKKGNQITFKAIAKGGDGDYEYAFRQYEVATETAITAREYSPDNTWIWDTNSLQGDFLISAWVRKAGTSSRWDGFKKIPYRIE